MLLLGCLFAFGVAAPPRFSLDSERWVSVWNGDVIAPQLGEGKEAPGDTGR
jgi:hypothetical protein